MKLVYAILEVVFISCNVLRLKIKRTWGILVIIYRVIGSKQCVHYCCKSEHGRCFGSTKKISGLPHDSSQETSSKKSYEAWIAHLLGLVNRLWHELVISLDRSLFSSFWYRSVDLIATAGVPIRSPFGAHTVCTSLVTGRPGNSGSI